MAYGYERVVAVASVMVISLGAASLLYTPWHPSSAVSGTRVGDPGGIGVSFRFVVPGAPGPGPRALVHVATSDDNREWGDHALAVYLDEKDRPCAQVRPLGSRRAPLFDDQFRRIPVFALLRGSSPVLPAQRVTLSVEVSSQAAHLFVNGKLERSAFGDYEITGAKRLHAVRSEGAAAFRVSDVQIYRPEL